MNKKGFVFIETIITIVILTASLLYVYKIFNNIVILESNRIHYDDIAYLYKTNHIKAFYKEKDLSNVINSLTDELPIQTIGCDYGDIFSDENEKNACLELTDQLNIKSIALSKSDLSFVKNCNNSNSIACSYLNVFSMEEIDYLKTLGQIPDADYVMIVEYSKTLDNDIVENNYTWIKF